MKTIIKLGMLQLMVMFLMVEYVEEVVEYVEDEVE